MTAKNKWRKLRNAYLDWSEIKHAYTEKRIKFYLSKDRRLAKAAIREEVKNYGND
jgi:hypothetical protein